jgi:hypothetical protein
MKRALTLLLAAGLSLSAPAKPAFKGGSWVGNGGDSLAMAIYSRVRELYKAVKVLSPDCAAQIPMTKGDFAEILVDLEITTSPMPLWREENGRQVFKEAMNYANHVTIDFYRDAYKESKNRDQLILHEIMGLKEIDDPKGEVSERFAAILADKSCTQRSEGKPEKNIEASAESAELGQGEIPVYSEIDRKGVIYFLVTGRNKIFRYSVPESKYLPPLSTGDNPITIGVAPDGDRVYVAYMDRKITYFEPFKNLDEKAFATAEARSQGFNHMDVDRFNSSEISKLIVNGGSIAVIPGGREFLTFVFYSRRGQHIGQADLISAAVSIAPDYNGHGIYFVTGFSPQNLAFVPFHNGSWLEKRWPYHGAFPANGPLAISPLYVALGSGYIVSNGKMDLLKKLGETFERAAWVGGKLFTSTSQKSGFVIRGFTAPTFENTFEHKQEMGALIGLHSFDKYLLAVWADALGNVKIEKIQ